jgi:MFS family permease
VYSFPNLILPLAAGIIIDKVGTRLCIIIFCLILFLGQTITTIGTVWLPNEGDSPEHLNSALMVMLVGRTIFACGAESLFVSISKHFFLLLRCCDCGMV